MSSSTSPRARPVPRMVFAAMKSRARAGVTNTAVTVLSWTSMETSDANANVSIIRTKKASSGRICSWSEIWSPARSTPRITVLVAMSTDGTSPAAKNRDLGRESFHQRQVLRR
jgi:hypothetical protein